jgi:methyltransferase family protein
MKWLLQNVRSRARFAIKNPRYALNAMVREFTFADERFLARLTGSSPRQIRTYLDEPINTSAFAAHLRSEKEHFRSLSIESADLFAKKILNQYAAVRALAPDCIVETGVANGVSSSYLLLALQKNERGRLHSIGLADTAFLPLGKDPGWLVPQWLRPAWQAHLGDALEILPRLLRQMGKIGIFIHDSLHTYDHMMWEFETAYPHLLSDHALWNNSFYDSARNISAPEVQIIRGVGFLRKN